MISNSKVTIYHKGLDLKTRTETWTRHNYDDVWFFGGQGSGINKGYQDANDFDCRIWYKTNPKLCLSNFAKGDIVVNDHLELDINTQQDLSNYLVFNIKSINDNNLGNNPHIHIGGI